MDVLATFHPAIRSWFERRFAAPTEAQARGWPAIMHGGDVLIAAPTGSGKTLAAFLASIDSLWRRAESGALGDVVDVIYVSPLKALSNDIYRNLEAPLEEIRVVAKELNLSQANIRVAVRTGDTTASARQEIIKNPPHILITTPESLYLMLTAENSRKIIKSARTVIVDEIHALLRDKRGSHLALTLARLDALCETRPNRIGLSATQRPIEETAKFLVGSDRNRIAGSPDCAIVDLGHQREIDLAIEVPPTELQAVASHEQWSDIYNRLAQLVEEHRTTLIFVNTRRAAERVAHHLAERLGHDKVGAHHGSLAKDRRLKLEQRLKTGEMKALVATASLELGIDIGSIDLVCQLESPRSIGTFLQRVGRSGHALGLTAKGRLFPTTRDELVECVALVRAVRLGRLDRVHPPVAPLDILAQQIVAECACRPWNEDELFDLVRQARPYAELSREDFDEIVTMLNEGYGNGGGRVQGYLYRDRINGVISARRGARQVAIESGGAIPEQADYRVIAEPEGTLVGTVNEDFAVESMGGDIFLLGTTAWRILRVEANTVRVEDAQGAPPTIPFWLGEAPARTAELSEEVASVRREIALRLDRGQNPTAWLMSEYGLDDYGAEQLLDYIRVGKQALGVVPTDTDVVFERFFDEAGGMQLVVHAPFGGRINRAMGLSLRKRFCRLLDFELQTAASDDAIVLSLGPQHSFPLEDVFQFLHPNTVEEMLTQALLASPMFTARWRWNATRALAVLRQHHGRRVPPQLQRMRADDLLGTVFPQQVGCQENISGPIDLPDHPLVRQTVYDCLHEAMDLDGLIDLLIRVRDGEVRFHARETTEPSIFTHEILNSKPYTYLDDAPLEERRARAVVMRRTLPENARDLGALDAEAIERVRQEAWPEPRDAEELHDVLLSMVALRAGYGICWNSLFDELVQAGRAAVVQTTDDAVLWFAAENIHLVEKLYPGAQVRPALQLPRNIQLPDAERDQAVVAMLRGHIECLGPVTVSSLAQRMALSKSDVMIGLAQLEGGGVVLRGRFTAGISDEEFCERRLLARVHRYTLDRLRREIEPVSTHHFLRFLLRWQHVAPDTRMEGKRGLLAVIAQLQGFEVPVAAWERHILPSRVAEYRSGWLDELCLSGEVLWARHTPGKSSGNGASSAAASMATPISLAIRSDFPLLLKAVRGSESPPEPAAGAAREVLDVLRSRGALFVDDLISTTRHLPTDVERGLWELVARGLVTADGFQALRSLMSSSRRRHVRIHRPLGGFRERERSFSLGVPSGRWALLPDMEEDFALFADDLIAEAWAAQLLRRYGVVFRSLVQRESMALPWRDVLRAFRRLEARGVIRGGRFVEGFYGEQYALPEAVESLRRMRRQEKKGETVWLSAVDPLNLIGVVTPGARLPATVTKSLVYRDGLPQAVEEGDKRSRRNDIATLSA